MRIAGIALADQESSGSKATVFLSMCVAILRKSRVFTACTPGNRDTFYGTREEGHALEECGKSPEAARLDSAPSACVSAWECMGDKRSTVPISGSSNIP